MSARTTIAESLSHPPGWVAISVDPAPDGVDMAVRIARRHPDRPYASPTGWQAAPYAYVPRDIVRDAGRLELHFGPEMSRHVGVDTNVILEIPALNVKDRHFWPAIAAAHGVSDLDVKLPAPPSPPETVVAVPLPVPKLPETMPPDEPKTGKSQYVITDPVVVAGPIGVRRRAPWMGAGLLVLLVAGGIGAYLFWPREPAAPAMPGFEARYQTFRDAGGHADDLLSLGLEAMAAGQTDLGFRAITLAADRNLPSAKMKLARWYDPLETETGPVQRSANVAALYYSGAAAAGATGASSGLARLCSANPESAGDGMQDFDKATYCP